VSGFAAGCCGCCFGAVGGAFEGWFFGGGGLYTLVTGFPGLGVGRELSCWGAFFAFQAASVVVLGGAGRLLTVELDPGGCCVTGSGLARRSLLVEAW